MIFQTLTILVLSLLLARHRWQGNRMHRAVREWYQQQSVLLAHEADSVRDSSLQELFALRRSLELAASNQPEGSSADYQVWIRQLEGLQTSLNRFIDRLLPPFAEESLPLAVAAHLRKFKHPEKEFEFSIESAKDWDLDDPLHINKAILAFFQGLDSSFGGANGITTIDLAFDRVKDRKQVLVKLQCLNVHTERLHQKVQDLCQMVVFLSPIEYQLISDEQSLSLAFRWSTLEKK
ncbi:MAG: hypothetical protein AAFY20_11355 [Cyanobacteria bacterium J06639_14]